MKDVCVLFPYYQDDYTTRHNYDILKKTNADLDIYPLVRDIEFQPYLANTVDLNRAKQWALDQPVIRDRAFLWRNGDLPIYDFFLNQAELYQRYVYIEADTICNTSIRDLYQENWNDDLVCKMPKGYEGPQDPWYQFRCLTPKMRDYYTVALGSQYLAGATPLCGILVSLRCMQEVVKNIRTRPHVFRNMYCEIRIATAASLGHFKATAATRLAASPLFNWFTIPYQDMMIKQPGIYHAIKRIPEGDVP